MVEPTRRGQRLEVPGWLARGARKTDADASIASAAWLIDYMCKKVGIEDLSETSLLDYGCGVKFTQALLELDLPVRRYVGIDVYAEMIDFLTENVDDPRFEYHAIDTHNELYNPEGAPLTEATELPVGDDRFGLICLFSVFTHLAPHDYSALLKVLRRYVEPTGRLFFTLYIDEKTEGGHGLMDMFARAFARQAAERSEQIAEAQKAGAGRRIETFRDLDPKEPLKWAVYSRSHALELIEDTGWEVLSLSPPQEYLQHHIVCAPV